MLLPAFPKTVHEQSPVTSEKIVLTTAPGTEQESSHMASEQMTLPMCDRSKLQHAVARDGGSEAFAFGIRRDAVSYRCVTFRGV